MRKIGELKGKPIIEGNPNEIKKNQIHYKESDGSITLSERKEDNTLSSVTSGSGSGEGVKEYYYKVIGGEEILSIIKPSLNMLGIKSVVCTTYKNETIFVEAYVTDEKTCFPGLLLSKINDAFAISERSVYICQELPDDYEIAMIPKGDLRTKLLGVGQTEEQVNELMSYFQEITKEEYESMITYKPE